jgi:hypothetical protein
MPRSLLVSAVVALALTPALSAAQGMRAFTLEFDNDGFAFWDPPSQRADWYYTHGMRLAATLARAPAGVGDVVCTGAEVPAAGCFVTHVALGHQIYTPQDVFSAHPPVNDHPYGGFLYVDMAGERVDLSGSTRVEVRVGVTGEPSLGQQAHQGFHRWLDKAEPTGWEYQIPFEVAFAVAVHRTAFWSPLPASLPLSVSVAPRWGATLGTLRTSADAGLGLRAGWNVGPAVDWSGARAGGFYGVVDVGVGGELVIRDLFLDGSTFAESVATTKNEWVHRRSAGLQLGVGGFGLEFSATRVSPRFRAQRVAHTHGTLKLIIRP